MRPPERRLTPREPRPPPRRANLSLMKAQQWKVGMATITAVVEEETLHIPPEFFFPDATAAAVAEHTWLVPDYADERGNIALRVQAFVIEVANRRVLVDPCVGNS